MKHTATFSDITVIESVDVGKSGRRLVEDIEALISSSGRTLTVEYRPVFDAFQFNTELKRIAVRARNGCRPLLHLECHGSVDGIQLESGEQVSWTDLKPKLVEINIASRCNLLVVMATCHGANLVAALDLTDRAPCWGFFGPSNEISQGRLEDAYGMFYRTMIVDDNPTAAATKLLAKYEGRQDYLLMTAEVFCTELFSKYLARDCSEPRLHARAQAMAARAIKEKTARTPGPGRLLRSLRRVQPVSFSNFVNTFFMIDLYPENAERFPVSYRETLVAAEAIAGVKINVAREVR